MYKEAIAHPEKMAMKLSIYYKEQLEIYFLFFSQIRY